MIDLGVDVPQLVNQIIHGLGLLGNAMDTINRFCLFEHGLYLLFLFDLLEFD